MQYILVGSILQTALCFVVAGDVVVLSKQHFGQSTIYISGQPTESVSLQKKTVCHSKSLKIISRESKVPPQGHPLQEIRP